MNFNNAQQSPKFFGKTTSARCFVLSFPLCAAANSRVHNITFPFSMEIPVEEIFLNRNIKKKTEWKRFTSFQHFSQSWHRVSMWWYAWIGIIENQLNRSWFSNIWANLHETENWSNPAPFYAALTGKKNTFILASVLNYSIRI